MKRFLVLSWIILSVFFMYLPGFVNATCSVNCLEYCGEFGSHGYCTDYIYEQLGARQAGDGGSWIGNISADEVQADDVAIFDFGTYGHVALVESVSGDNITISEWNWSNSYEEEDSNIDCFVTDNYGDVTVRTIAKSSVTRFWRSNFSSAWSPPDQIEIRIVGGIGWYPTNKTCIRATHWYGIKNGQPVMTYGSNSACYSAGTGYITSYQYQEILFGNDLPQVCQ